jgi:hypothetical protein
MVVSFYYIILELTDLSFLVYAVGQFKDDQVQDHNHALNKRIATLTQNPGAEGFQGVNNVPSGYIAYASASTISTGRHGDTTRTKQKGVKYIVKVL